MEDKFETLRQVYHDKVYKSVSKSDSRFPVACATYRRNYSCFMPSDKKAKILDIGCGPGQFLRFCLNNGYENIMGVDLSPGHVQYVQDNVTRNVIKSDGFKFVSSCLNVYDLIALNNVIEHMTKDKGIELVGAIKRALKPNGRILMRTFNAAAFGGIISWCNAMDHECGYTERSLWVLLNMWDFKNIKLIPWVSNNLIVRILRAPVELRLRLMYKYVYGGIYPRICTKDIAVTGVA